MPVGRRAGRRAALEAQAARQAAARRLAERHQERLAALAHQAVVHPAAGPAQLWAAPLGADPADQRQWAYLGWSEDQVVEIPDRGLWQLAAPAPLEFPAIPDLELGARWARAAGPVQATLEQVAAQVQALGEALGRGLNLAGLDWYQAVHRVLADLDPGPPVEPADLAVELERLEEDRCPVGLAGVLVPRGAERLGLCPCPRCRRP